MKLDSISWKILSRLQQDGRASLASIARDVSMSLPAVTERIKRMEEQGIIEGYRAVINEAELGRTLKVFIQLKTPASRYRSFLDYAEQTEAIRECHHITGDGAFIIQVLIEDIRQLEPLVENLSSFGETKTSIVMSSPLMKTMISP
ncbi:MAG: Lrp/AsnC family transcriptional regulator [Motiliproteus sp.]